MPTEPSREQRTFTIRQLCLEFKCTPRALRFYEDKGLLAPQRRGQRRIYSYRDRGRLRVILRCKRVNLSLSDIREILDLYEQEGVSAQRATALRKLRQRLVDLERSREDLDQTITALRGVCERLEQRLAQAPPSAPRLSARAAPALAPELASAD
jgi:DNA-binding transcriptional MerR regulator